MPSSHRRARLWLALLLIVSLAALTAGEIMVRAAGLRPWNTKGFLVEVDPGSSLATFHPELGYTGRTGSFESPRTERSSSTSRTSSADIGSLARGFPQPPLPEPGSGSSVNLIRHVFKTDPLICKKCGGKMRVVSFITNTVTYCL